MSVSPSENRTETRGRAPARSRAATRERLLQSGTELFAESGLHAVTSHAIASRAGVAAGTFYLHFEDKHALFREIALGAMHELETAMRAAHQAADSRETGIRARARVLVEFAQAHRDLVRILFGRNRDGGQNGEGGGVGEEALVAFTELYRERVELTRAGLAPAVAARAIVGLWAHTLAWWAEQPDRATPEELIHTLATLEWSCVAGTSIDPTPS